MSDDLVLVVNAGSSSVKIALFDASLACLAAGSVTEIGGAARLTAFGRERACAVKDHDGALSVLLDELAGAGYPLKRLGAAGHRVVHGGRKLNTASVVTANTLAEIEACTPLAPLHNPHNLAALHAVGRLVPGLPQVAVFDTAFHATNPEVALRYALPAAEERKGLRRFGFHGISYESLVVRLPGLLGGRLPARVLAMHLGNGASLCAIRDGKSVATTMGYSPLDGLTMGTRAGSIDGNAVLRLAEDHGIEGAARILNREAGLLALGGASDMRSLGAADTDDARFAIAHFCYWAVRHAGSMIAAMGGLDCVAFTGGIGENDARVRAAICEGLGFLGVTLDAAANTAGKSRIDKGENPVSVLVVPAQEERHIAATTVALLKR